jgi:uncharacterized protein YidB (DUF937 family)
MKETADMAWIDSIVAEAPERFGLGPAAGRFMQEVISLVTGGPGGLGGFIEKLTASGFGSLLAAWERGEVQDAVSSVAVEQLFGAAPLRAAAKRIGIDREQLERAVGEILPRLITGMAPGGVASETAIAEAREAVLRTDVPLIAAADVAPAAAVLPAPPTPAAITPVVPPVAGALAAPADAKVIAPVAPVAPPVADVPVQRPRAEPAPKPRVAAAPVERASFGWALPVVGLLATLVGIYLLFAPAR